MSGNIMRALKTFELAQHHEKIYDNPNALIEAGFPAFFLRPLVEVFKSSEGYKYCLNGKIVDEMIGISHLSLIYAIAKHVGVPPDTGAKFNGRGFAMQANIEAIRVVLEEHAKNTDAKTSVAPTLKTFSVVVFLQKTDRFESAKDELLSIAKGHRGEVYDQGDAIVFSFGCEAHPEAEALNRELAHFPAKYGSVLLLQNPLG